MVKSTQGVVAPLRVEPKDTLLEVLEQLMSWMDKLESSRSLQEVPSVELPQRERETAAAERRRQKVVYIFVVASRGTLVEVVPNQRRYLIRETSVPWGGYPDPKGCNKGSGFVGYYSVYC